MKKLLILILFLVAGCGTVRMPLRPAPEFYKAKTITVQSQHEDRQGVAQQIERRLAENNYTIITQQQREKGTPSYLLTFSYDAYFDVVWWSFKMFSAQITDPETGELISQASFSGDKRISSVLDSFVKQLTTEKQGELK